MRIGNRSFYEHIRLLAPLLGFIAAVWAGRMLLDAAAMQRQPGQNPAGASRQPSPAAQAVGGREPG